MARRCAWSRVCSRPFQRPPPPLPNERETILIKNVFFPFKTFRKGTNTGFIMRERGYTAAPIVVSSLLTSPEMMATKAAGGLVGDKEVISALFNTLLESEFSTGVVVDGFPRTKVQARVVHMLHDRMMALRNANRDGSKDMVFARPVFRICVLHVDENESVARQLGRGDRARAHNEKVKATGKGELQDLRPTDYDPALAAKRYRSFEESTFEALEYLGQYFIYNFVNAQGDFAAVEANIIREMEYQSSLELNPETHDMVHDLPRADEVIVHARQMLVKRLDGYSSASPNELQSVVTMLEKLCYPLVQRNVVAGECEFYYEPNAETRVESIQMAIDILSDRGFRASYSESAPSGKDNGVEIKVRWEPPVIRKKQR